ncbi:MAG: hypothetical protein IH859_01050 [Chloroflexi bacterium]|nr:hypothetical protein [Chloroflexota bacterium]
MADLKQSSSDIVWNIVGVLAAVALILYIASTFFNLDTGGFIPVSGGNAPFFADPTLRPTLNAAAPTASDNPTATEAPAAETETGIPAPTASSIPTDTPTVTATPEPFPLVLADYGLDAQFTLHQLRPGESYTFLAELYETAVVVLEALNFNKEGKRLWVGQYVVVIPWLMSAPSELPAFTVLQIFERTRLQDLAVEYGISVDELRFYNALAAEVTSVEMRVLLLPVHGEEG